MLTTGRSGSTWLLQALASHAEIALPQRQIDCVDSELLRPGGFDAHCREYERLTDTWVAGQNGLIDAFYRFSGAAAYAGFKSMPHRHDDFAAFVARPDIQFITLRRADTASAVSSFLLAMHAGTWRRRGDVPAQRWTFGEDNAEQVRSILNRLRANHAALAAVPGAIRLTYEDLCVRGYVSPALDAFFGRRIQFPEARPPVHGSTYTGNWEAFLDCLGLSAEEAAAGA